MPKMCVENVPGDAALTHQPHGSGNNLGPEGGAAVAGALTVLTGLQKLGMGYIIQNFANL